MKNLIIALSTAAVLSISVSAMAADASVTVEKSSINQIQEGFNLEQVAVIGMVSEDFDANATITVKGSTIIQKQTRHDNKQTARIGVIGCDCVNIHDKKHKKNH